MSDVAPDWFHNTIVSGVQQLHVLSLQGTPAAETVTLTAQVWIDTLWNTPRSWEEDRDAPRLREAFRSIAQRVDRWPAPKAVLDNMPNAAPVPLLTEEPKSDPVKVAAYRKQLRELAAKWKGKP
jgi:hypothetical protein